jgi:hypothetical protein
MKEAAEEPDATKKKEALTLSKPTAISQKPAWFESSYAAESQRDRDRKLFSS